MNKQQSYLLLSAATILYLVAPIFIFFCFWLRPEFAVIGIIALLPATISAIYHLLQGKFFFHIKGETAAFRWHIIAGVILLLWVLLSGTGGFGHQNTDYRASNALLHDLIQRPWPMIMHVNGQDLPLVYYIAYYLPSAVVGKLWGWGAANMFSLGWTACGTLLAFIWFCRLTHIQFGNRQWILIPCALIFAFAGGLDLVGAVLFDWETQREYGNIEWWAHSFQLSAQTTLLYWVPQHSIAAWLITGMVSEALTNEARDLRYVGMAIAATLLWSPFSVLGIAPFAGAMLIRYVWKERAALLTRPVLLLNGIAIITLATNTAFLSANSFKFPISSILLIEPIGNALLHLGLFWMLEFGILVLILITLARVEHDNVPSIRYTILRAISITILFLLPLLKIGFYNDIVMRGSIPALFVLWAWVAHAQLSQGQRGAPRLLRQALLIVLAVGCATALLEMSRSIGQFQIGPPNQVLTSEEANTPEIIQQRLGSTDSFFFRYLGRKP